MDIWKFSIIIWIISVLSAIITSSFVINIIWFITNYLFVTISIFTKIFIYLKLINIYFAILMSFIILISLIWNYLGKYNMEHIIIIPTIWLIFVLKYYINSFINCLILFDKVSKGIYFSYFTIMLFLLKYFVDSFLIE